MKSFINHFISTTINEADDMIIEYRNVSGQFYTNSSDFYKVIEMIRKDSLNSGKIYAKITFILDDKKDNPIKVSFDFTQAGDIDAEHIVWCPEQY